MSLKESIKKILKENMDNLNWADEIPTMLEPWDMVNHIMAPGVNMSELDELIQRTQVKVKIKDEYADVFAKALDGCGEFYLFDYNVYNAENFIFNIGGVNNFSISELYCDNHFEIESFGYEKNRYDSILLGDIDGGDWSFWVIEPWLDLIFIPKK